MEGFKYFFNYIYNIPAAYVITTLTLIIEEIIVTIFIFFYLLQKYEKQIEQKNRTLNYKHFSIIKCTFDYCFVKQ
ncbi:MAG: hypothetical protein RL619_1855 [Bacteroidota bacterium]